MIPFQELGGSPTERYTSEGFKATREFLVPWEQRNEFASVVFGIGSSSANVSRLAYPGRSDVYAYELRYEPLDPDTVGVRELKDPTTDIVHYNGSFARAKVEYRTLESIDRLDGPINEEGTSITYRMVIESEEIEIPSQGWTWGMTGMTLANDIVLRKSIPHTIHFVTWSNVVDPPWEEITRQQGTVNNATFLGCAPETLLFQGAEAHKLYKPGVGLEEGGAAFTWAIKYSFREKSIKSDGGIFGWNHALLSQTNQWLIVRNGNTRIYDSSDFNDLFRSVLPEDVP